MKMVYRMHKFDNEIVPARTQITREDFEMNNEKNESEVIIEPEFYPEKRCSRKAEAARNNFWIEEDK